MGKLAWYFNRLRAMNLPEVGWRLQQKCLQGQEKKRYGKRDMAVTACLFDRALQPLRFDADKLGLNYGNAAFHAETRIHLLGGYDYGKYREQWSAGFQTGREWDNAFSYALNYKQRDDIGDARTNWELNRHFQFALLAKAYYATGEKQYAEELERLFTDWNRRNPFLHGISWTSVMEVAIRCIQWTVALAFLRSKGYTAGGALLMDMETGIKNMAAYIARHYSRFSSANNHLLVEATAIAYAGFAFDHEPWKQLAIRILDEELTKQNYADGVNMEMALHYQTFGMEAYALVMHLMQSAGMTVPEPWAVMMERQCEFVVCSMVSETRACEFGDNDEGKILDLEGGDICHYRYLLQLCSMVLGKRFESFGRVSETIAWLYPLAEIASVKEMPLWEATESRTFGQGGYTFLRSHDGKVMIGIDHAPLGFGSIAAHGHADALSFQLYVDGKCILGDPGTYIYHCNLQKRNEYRQSQNHNTVCAMNEEEQSQMMGAFLWGKKAETRLVKSSLSAEGDTLQGECRWQNGFVHTRSFDFDREHRLVMDDAFEATAQGYASLVLHPDCQVTLTDGAAVIERDGITVRIEADALPEIADACYSEEYGKEEKTKKLVYKLNNNKLKSTIWIEKY